MNVTGISMKHTFFRDMSTMFAVMVPVIMILWILLRDFPEILAIITTIIGVVWVIIGTRLIFISFETIKNGKNGPFEESIIFVQNKIDAWCIVKLEKEYSCKGCNSLFFDYTPKFCPKCGSDNIQKTDKTEEKKYIFTIGFSHIQAYSILVFAGTVIACSQLFWPDDLTFATLLAITFGCIFAFAFFVEHIASKRNKNNKNNTPVNALFVEYHGMYYTKLGNNFRPVPECNHILRLGGPYCTKCGCLLEYSTKIKFDPVPNRQKWSKRKI